MRTPVFLSVGGKRDAIFAKEVHEKLGETLAYHFMVTGEENVKFRPEIEAKINECDVFVVFWSEDYLASLHACNELAYFRKLVESGAAPKKQLMLVPRDGSGPDIQGKWINPITQKADEFILGNWRYERAVDVASDSERVSQLIRRKLQHLDIISDILIVRGWIVDQFKSEITLPNYLARELIFVTGMEGDGRRTALRQFMQQTYPHRIERSLSLDSAEGPEDLLIHLMEVCGVSTAARNEIFDSISNQSSTLQKELRKLLHLSRDTKSYYVIAIDRFVAIDSVAIPIWLSDLLSVFGVGKSPLIFIVTSSPVNDALLTHYPHAGRVRVPGLEDEEMKELSHRLALEDPDPTRWTLQKKESVAKTSGSSPAICKSIMRGLAAEPTLDFVDEIARRAEIDFGQTLAGLMAHWVKYYQDKRSDLFALRVIEKLGVTSKDALDEILQPIVSESGAIDLYTMRDQGLVEQLSDGVYRIPPLVQRRLGDALWKSIDTRDVDALFENFSKKVLINRSEYGAIYASNAAVAVTRSGEDVGKDFERYLTVSMLFKTGLDRYTNRQWKLANRTLQRVLMRLKDNNGSVDVNSQIEIARYAGLAAARCSEKQIVDEACAFLMSKFSKTKRSQSAKAMAQFVRGFMYRIGRLYLQAITEFESALQLLNNEKHVERQRAAVFTELASTYLRTQPPQFDNALKMARAAFAEKDVTHTLNALIHALVLFVFRSGRIKNGNTATAYIEEIENHLQQLKTRSSGNGQDFHVQRTAEYERERRIWERAVASSDLTYSYSSEEQFSPIELDFL